MTTARALIPPVALNLARRAKQAMLGYGFSGDYSSWADAIAASTGYETVAMLAKVPGWVEAQRRTSVHLTSRAQRLLAAFSVPALHFGRPLRVLDFGGGTGADYYLLRQYLGPLTWHVVETPQMVGACTPYAEDGLTFHTEPQGSYDVVLMSGVLQYLERPAEKFRELSAIAPYAIVDRTTFIDGRDRLTVQTVPASNYAASYPCWFLSKRGFAVNAIMQWGSEEVHLLDGREVIASGFLSR